MKVEAWLTYEQEPVVYPDDRKAFFEKALGHDSFSSNEAYFLSVRGEGSLEEHVHSIAVDSSGVFNHRKVILCQRMNQQMNLVVVFSNQF